MSGVGGMIILRLYSIYDRCVIKFLTPDDQQKK